MNREQRHLEWSIRRAQRKVLRDQMVEDEETGPFVPDLPALTGPQVDSIEALSDETLAEA